MLTLCNGQGYVLMPFLGARATLPVLNTSVKSLCSTRCYSQHQPDPPLTNQLQERYREFDIAGLQRVAMEASSAGPCVRMEKLGEGTYNKAFKLTMANDKMLVARIPSLNAGPDFLTTASEVATTDFVSCSDYIVMEHAPGTQLAFVWPDMKVQCNVQSIKDIVEIQHKLLSVHFSHYGCLYFAEDAPPGPHSAMLTGDDLSHAFKKNVADKFSIGPMVNASSGIRNGASALGLIQAPSLREISWLEKHADRNPIEGLDIAGAFLCHADMSSANIFVDDDGNITGIIDWQSLAACPLFVGGRPPRFLDYRGEQLSELPEDFDTLDEQKQKSIKYQQDNSKILYIYNDYTEERNPLLHKRPGECPLNFSPEEIRKHYEDGEGWNGAQDIWVFIEHILDRDGWASNETYETAKSIYDYIQEFQDAHPVSNVTTLASTRGSGSRERWIPM
ncbi:kinase-like domain-containing protein [Aspergillus stella-maris]|uniref:kinase-like domain-containing protein n=1 Tax=Aspergillus stella-maris TaxID=1810926 RepID=UPI003CCCA923